MADQQSAIEQSAERLVLALLEFLAALKQSPALVHGVHPVPTQCGACEPAVPLQASGHWLPRQREYAPAPREHLPVRCSVDAEGIRT